MIVEAILTVLAASSAAEFDRTQLAETTYEACSVFDVDKDGALDVATGEYWFAGPDWKTRHKICTVAPNGDYFDDFSDFPMDVNGDGWLDIVTGAWWGQKVLWRENPQGRPVEWKLHDIATVGNVERPCFWDIDGDGHLEVVPNTPGNPQRIFQLERDAAGKPLGTFRAHQPSDVPSTHGLGFGDINGDGRGDLIFASGWLEGPAKPMEQPWEFRAEFNLGNGASVPILVHDVNGDGRNDLIVGMGHDYGLAWWEQGEANGARTWTKHEIETDKSQFHEMQLADLDRDGDLELITGKRYYAHSGNDPGAEDSIGLYYYEIAGGAFHRTVLNFGKKGEASGTGIYMWIMDMTGDGFPEILAPGKEGLYLFTNKGKK